jgi:DNA primase
MAGIDFASIRAQVSIRQVLELLNFMPSSREGFQLRGPCPIHRSTSAESRSFSVNFDRNVFQCFSCGAQGNQIDLWAKSQSLTLIEAGRDLSRRFDLPLADSALVESE